MPASIAGKYKLVKINGKNVPEGVSTLELTASEAPGEYMLNAKVANVMGGNVKYEGGKLKGLLMSTMMMGPPLEMEIEQLLGAGLSSGMKVEMQGSSFKLSHSKESLHYVRA